MPKTPAHIIRDEIRALASYHVPDARGMVKLDAMENPYPLPAELRERISQLTAAAALNRYPDPAARELTAVVRSAMAVPAGMEVLLGNGSDELIQMLALAVAKPGAVMMGLEPSFVMFRMIASFTGMSYVGVELNEDFAVDAAKVVAAIERHQPALVFVAYPNNPSGNLFDAGAVDRIIEAAPGIVVVDEAYHAFADASFMPRLAEFPNLLVMRTLSKLGLAGLRVGLLAGRGEWLHELDKVRLPYNVSVLTQLVATEVLQHRQVLESQAAAIRAERARVFGELQNISGIEAYASDANFILFRVAAAQRVFTGLKQRGVLVKNLHGAHPRLANCLRVTIGTPAENTRFMRELAAALAD
jgi:histidinol-phosphate aminotransferase